jgi:Kef-type K+ transport system membrane component KefB
LIAAVAIGLAGARLWLGLIDPVREHTLAHYVPAVGPPLICLSSAVVFVGLARERTRFRRSARRPGIAATIVTLIFALLVLGYSAAFHRRSGTALSIIAIETIWFLATYAGSMILTIWLWIWLSGRWQREDNWLGYLGRGIGAAWIVLGISNVAVRVLV